MNIIIAGVGIVGTALAEHLSVEGHQVSVIDNRRSRLKEVGERFDVLTVLGHASSPSVLERAGISSADMVIAVTASDEVNFLIGIIAARLNVEHRIVRVRNRELVDDESVLGAREAGLDHVINPEPQVVDALLRMIEIPGATDAATLAGGRIYVVAFDIADDSPALDKTPAQLRAELDAFLILYITREGNVIVPTGSDKLRAGDNVHVLVSADKISQLIPVFHRRSEITQRVVVSGATRIGRKLAAELQHKVDRVVLIEPDPEAAEEAASALPHTTVLMSDPTKGDVLDEASVDACDLFCAVSFEDHINMLTALLAKKHGAKKAAAVVRKPEYVEVLNSLGIEIVLSPRLVTIGEILMHVRRGHVHSVTRMADGLAEVLELEAVPGCPVTLGAIKDLKIPKDALLGAVIRGDMIEVASGSTCVEPGDRVIVFTLPSAIHKIERLFI